MLLAGRKKGVSVFLTLAIILVLVVWFVKIYNGLQRGGNDVKRARADIMASMKKRIDLVGRLIDIAKSYGEHEKLTQLSSVGSLNSIADAIAAGREANRAINTLASLAMAHPDLKANGTYQQLMTQLEEIETNLQARREGYNAEVSRYNSYRSSLPQALFAGSIGFPEAPFFTVDGDGLEALPDFQTDDGKMLRDSIQRMGEKAGTLATQAKSQVSTAIADARTRREAQLTDQTNKPE